MSSTLNLINVYKRFGISMVGDTVYCHVYLQEGVKLTDYPTLKTVSEIQSFDDDGGSHQNLHH